DNVVHLDWENAPADHAILTVKWTLNQISYHAKRPKAGLITRDADKPTTKAWLKLRNELKERFRKIPVKIHLPIQNQLLWDQYRRCNGQEGLTLMDDEGNDLNPEEARRQLAKMLQDRWSHADGKHIPKRTESQFGEGFPPTTREILKAIKATNRKAATGLDGIPAKYVDQIPVEDIQQLTELIWRHTSIPRQLVDMKVKPIPKKDSRTTVQNTRPITIPSTVMKIINQVILESITPYIEDKLLPQQHAYRKGRGTATAITELFTKLKQPGQTLLLLDLSKAFDTVNHAALFAALKKTGLPAKEYNLVRDQYVDCEVRIQWAKRFAQPFLLRNGIRQGCTLSTSLFNLVEAEREQKCRGKIPKWVNYSAIMYADDKAIIVDNPEHIQTIIEVNQQTASDYGMRQNNEKTAKLTLDMDTTEIRTVKWMGILLDNKLNMNPEVDARIRKAKAAATTFADTVKTIPPSMLAARVRITGACAVILPHLLYLWREIPFTPQQRSTMTDVATQLLAKVLGNTSGVSARTILQHVENITKGLTPRMKQMAEIPWELQKDTYADLSIAQTSDFHKQGQSVTVKKSGLSVYPPKNSVLLFSE
ncbi:reverse transcriptase family protein, partial [Gregarina niphandrodes]